MNEVRVEVSSQSEKVLFSESKHLPKDKVSGDFTGSVLIKNPDYSEEECPYSGAACDYAVGVFKGVLKSDATLNVSVVESPETSLKGLVPIGHRLVMELPLSSVSLDAARPVIAIISPSFPGAYEDAVGNAFAEISITLGDGREYVTLRNYKLGNSIFIQRADIRLALERFDLPRPETLRISVLPTHR